MTTETPTQEALAKFKGPFRYDDEIILEVIDSEGNPVAFPSSFDNESDEEAKLIGTAIADFLNQQVKRDVYTVDKETELLYPIIRKNGEFFMAIHSGEDDAKIITDKLNRLAGGHRSEFICERCLLRQDDTFPKNHDF
jgi:hypothetical protein